MDPINYNSAVASPLDSVLKGYQQGVGITQIQQAQAAQQAQLAQQQNQAQILQSLISNKNATADDYANAQLALPQLSENIGKVWATKNSAQQQSLVSDLSQWGAAIQNGKPEVAADMMRAKADAMENTNNGPTPDSKALRAQADAVIAHPDFGRVMINATLAAHPDGKKVIDNITAQGKESRDEALAPAALKKANAEAGTAETDSIQKRDSVIGSASGALLGKGASVQQIQTMLRTKAKQGLIGPDDAQTYIDTIPTDPKAREDWLGALQGAGLKPEEQMKYTTPTADAALSSKTQIQTTSMNNATSRYATNSAAATAANRLAFDKDQAEPDAPPVSNGKSGADFLSSIDAPKAAQVKALAEGRMSFPTGNAAKTPYWQGMLNAVAQYDPSFDAVNYSARSKARNDLVAGKTGGNIKAINTAIAHMGQLNDQLSALKNSDVPVINTVRNWAAKNLGDSDRQGKLAAADATAEGVAGEMAKVFRETGMSEHEINAWRTKFGNSTTPAAQKGTMNSAMHMLNGRMEAIQDQYKTGMGTTAAPLDILTPQSKVIFNKLLGSAPPVQAKPSAPVAALPGGWTVKEH